MMKKLFKKSLLGVAMLATAAGFSQQLTIVSIEPSTISTVELGEDITFTVTYLNEGTGAVAITGANSSFSIYGNGAGGPTAESGGDGKIDYAVTTGTPLTADITYTFIDTETTGTSPVIDIENSTDLATAGGATGASTWRYELRMFRGGLPNMQSNIVFAGGNSHFAAITTNRGTEVTAAGNGTAPSNFVGRWIDINEVTLPETASTDAIEGALSNSYVSGDALVVADAGDYQVLNIAGAVVFEGAVSGSIDISGLASGVYILKSANGTSKFVK